MTGRSTALARMPKVPATALSWKVAALVALLVVGAGATGLVLVGPVGQGSIQYLTSPVTRTTVVKQVVASGTVVPAATYDLAFGAYPVLETGGKPASAGTGLPWPVTSVAVKLGDHVATGAILATADSSAATAALQLAQANLAAAQAQLAVDTGGPTAVPYALAQARQQLTLAGQGQTDAAALNALALDQAQGAVQAAASKLAADQAAAVQADQAAVMAARRQVDSLKIANDLANLQGSHAWRGAVASLTQAQTALQLARLVLAADEAGAKAHTIYADQAAVAAAQLQFDTATLAEKDAFDQWKLTVQKDGVQMAGALTALLDAQTQLARDEGTKGSGPASATIQGDQAALTAARQQLDSLRVTSRSSGDKAASGVAAADLALAIAQSDQPRKVAMDRASVATAQESVRQAKLALGAATLRSPVDGVVATLAVTPGALAPAGTDVAIAADTMQVVAAVSETDLPQLRVGQKVTVTLTALGTTAAGTLSAIDPRGVAPSGGGVVTYPVVVTLDALPSGTTAAMSAQVAVTIAQAKDVLAVPSIALLGSTGHYRVRVLDASGSAVEKLVKVGLVTSSLTEISSGLSLGEPVVTGTTAPLQNAAAPAGGLPGLLPQGGGGNGGG